MITAQSPLDKLTRNLIMPEKFLNFKKLILDTATESQKELIQLAENYIAGLNNMFYDREITEFMLKEFDFPLLLKELRHEGLLEGKSRFEMIELSMNIRHIVRHTWELTGADGKTKTGDDLRKAWPIMWENDAVLTVEKLARDVMTM